MTSSVTRFFQTRSVFKTNLLLTFKCSTPIPICDFGPDHICSDGKCYSQSGCPMGTWEVSTSSCTCSSACNGISNSYLQVN